MNVINKRFEPNCDVAELQCHPENPREGDIGAIYTSIDTNGFYGALIVQESSKRILAGNHRYQAAIQKGARTIPVIWVECDDNAARRILAVDNRSNDLASYNMAELAELIDQIKLDDTGLGYAGTGWDEESFQNLLKDMEGSLFETSEPGLTDPDEIPEPPSMPTSKLGDLWILENHRLLCGDSTSENEIARLMEGHKAGLMNTDPPYGVSYANNERPNSGAATPRVINDNLRDEKLQEFLESAFSTAKKIALQNNAAWYLWHAHLTQGYFAAAAAAAQVILHRQIIWVKPALLLTRGQYHWKHEPCFMGWAQGNQPPDYGRGNGERDQTTVWALDHITRGERKEFNHSTPKPTALFEIPIIKHLKAGEICYEPFAGSGPQIIAAEKHARRCFALEIEPTYVDVIVNRWQNFTGKEAIHESGKTFAKIKRERA